MYAYSSAGHSKAGGIGQLISHTFGLAGTGIDSAPAGLIILSPRYKEFLADNHIEEKGLPEHGFFNYTEKGSAVGEGLVGLDIPVRVIIDASLGALPLAGGALRSYELACGLLGKEDPTTSILNFIEDHTSLHFSPDGNIQVGAHLGDVVTMDLEEGAWYTPNLAEDGIGALWNVVTLKELKAQHNPLDDVIKLAQCGASYLLQEQFKEQQQNPSY